MTKKHQGYQIIEPESLTSLLGNQAQAAVAVAVLEWVIDRIKIQSPKLFEEIEVEVIPVSYYGTYPAIGIRYNHDEMDDIGHMILTAIDFFVEHASFLDFLSF
jgi:hypothetical protein